MAEADRTQPEFSTGERLSRLEALHETFLISERGWQDQLDGRLRTLRLEMDARHDARKAEVDALRREFGTATVDQSKAIDKAEQAQDKQNELTREDAQRARESFEGRVAALERGESRGLAGIESISRFRAELIAALAVLVSIASVIVIATR